ncbi:P-loop containing nucleoside triphosphate hydrolase protein [Aspergillus aurantiobrunneus]
MSIPAKRSSSSDNGGSPVKAPKPSDAVPKVLGRLTIHRTICNAQNDHIDHPSQADYLDPPRLFGGDSRASDLRGEKRIEVVEARLRNNPTVDILFIKSYSCGAYHDSIRGRFTELQAPQHPINATVKRYFSVLEHNGDVAVPISEEIVIVAQDMQDTLQGLLKLQIERISSTQCVSAVVDRFYILSHHPQSFQIDSRMGTFLAIAGTVFAQEYQEAFELLSYRRVSRKHLAKLFFPKELVVTSTRQGHPRVYMVSEWPEWKEQSLVLPCVGYSFDGRFFREAQGIVLDWKFGDEERLITELAVYPLRFDEALKAHLMERGATFWRYRKRRLVCYKPSFLAVEGQASSSRYMIDAAAYHCPPRTPGIPNPNRQYLASEQYFADSPPDEQFQLLLPPTIPGFSFHDKRWMLVPVADTHEIEWNAESFNHLVLKSTKKDLVRALVAKHTGTTRPNDVIKGKGNGLIILLHGGPGTGKTLTAESVAELARRPLYRITCADLGTDIKEIERNLEAALSLGNVWECVVLFDEADVFLEERTQQDLARNVLVSIFLRVLEYYTGILILTTNRIGAFDEAIKSRVNLTLHYPALDESSRRRVWSNFITRLHCTNPRAKTDQILENVDELAKFSLNGREIRNSIQTAMLLAEFRDQPLQYSHLLEVIDVANEL